MINEIEIVEYKGFKNLKLDNLSQINIINDKSNIGKTALYIEVSAYPFLLKIKEPSSAPTVEATTSHLTLKR